MSYQIGPPFRGGSYASDAVLILTFHRVFRPQCRFLCDANPHPVSTPGVIEISYPLYLINTCPFSSLNIPSSRGILYESISVVISLFVRPSLLLGPLESCHDFKWLRDLSALSSSEFTLLTISLDFLDPIPAYAPS